MNFREALILRAFAVWTVYVWVTRIGNVLGDHQHGHGFGFKAIHVLPWGTEQDMFVFNNCIAGSSGISLKKSGFSGFTLDYMAAVDGNDLLGTATFAEAA